MSKRVRKYLLIMLAALLLSGCGKEQAAPSEPPGKLIGLTYSKSGGMERGNDFYIRINSGRIETMAYFDPNKLEDIQVQDLELDAQSWEAIETAITQLWPVLEEKEHEKANSLLYRIMNGFRNGAPMIRDSGDRTDFSLIWETEEGTVTISYRWDNSEPLYFELATLLKALAPQ